MSIGKGTRFVETVVIHCDHGRAGTTSDDECRAKASGDTGDEAAEDARAGGWDLGDGGKYHHARPRTWDLCPEHKGARPTAGDDVA